MTTTQPGSNPAPDSRSPLIKSQHQAFWSLCITSRYLGALLAGTAGYITMSMIGMPLRGLVCGLLVAAAIIVLHWWSIWSLSRPYADPGGYLESSRLSATCDWFPLSQVSFILLLFNPGTLSASKPAGFFTGVSALFFFQLVLIPAAFYLILLPRLVAANARDVERNANQTPG